MMEVDGSGKISVKRGEMMKEKDMKGVLLFIVKTGCEGNNDQHPHKF